MGALVLDPLPYEPRHLVLMSGLVRQIQESVGELYLVLYKKHAYWVRNLFGDLRDVRFFFVDDTFVTPPGFRVRKLDCTDIRKCYSAFRFPESTMRSRFVSTRFLEIEEKLLEGTLNEHPSYIVVVPDGGFIDASLIPEGLPHLVLDTYLNPFNYIRILEEARQVHVSAASPIVWIMEFLRVRAPTTVHHDPKSRSERLNLRNTRLKQVHHGRGAAIGN
jgi:hypothetical protein